MRRHIKQRLFEFMALVTGLMTIPLRVGAATRVEIEIENVFIAEKGFDDNDQVDWVVQGILPNACYKLGDTTVERLSLEKLRIVQYANRQNQGLCAHEALMPGYMKLPVPFSKVYNVGQLKAGRYSIDFRSEQGRRGLRLFTVAPAKAPTIDDLPYALVSSAWLPDVMRTTDDLRVTLSGSFNSSCTSIDHVEILHENDVVILLPVLKVEWGVLCMQVMIPFTHEVNLGKMQPGKHLLHVRTMNGKSINQVFELKG